MAVSRAAGPVVLAVLLAACVPGVPGVSAPEGVEILTRAEWGAAPAAGPMERHLPVHIVIHHTGMPAQPERPTSEKLRALQRFSQEQAELADGTFKAAWPDLPYHYYVAADGTVAEGRDARFVGDSNTEYPLRGRIHVVVEGNFEVEAPTEAQLDALRRLLGVLTARWAISPGEISGHRNHAETVCPGDALYRQMEALRRAAE